MLGEQYTGGTVDIAKCFDQVNRELVKQLAIAAGMPYGILDAYLRYQDNLHVHNAVAGGIGKGFTRRTGIPQGCPFSMMFIALVLDPWITQQRIAGNFPKILADDILLVAKGPDMLHKFSGGLADTHQYLVDMGARIAPDKNTNFASTTEAREWLKKTYWRAVGGAIKVEDNFRYLGAHICITGRNTANTLRKRFNSAICIMKKVARLPVNRSCKAKLIRAKIFPAALYGSEVCQPTERDIATLSTAIAGVIANKSVHHDIDWLFASCSRGKDLDVVSNLLARKVTMLRRNIAKRPQELWMYRDMVCRHAASGTPGATCQRNNEAQNDGTFDNISPAPHPTRASRAMWKDGPPHQTPSHTSWQIWYIWEPC